MIAPLKTRIDRISIPHSKRQISFQVFICDNAKDEWRFVDEFSTNFEAELLADKLRYDHLVREDYRIEGQGLEAAARYLYWAKKHQPDIVAASAKHLSPSKRAIINEIYKGLKAKGAIQ